MPHDSHSSNNPLLQLAADATNSQINELLTHHHTTPNRVLDLSDEPSPIELPHPNESVDVILARHVLHQLSDPTAALHKCARLLAPGGVVIAQEVDFGAMTWYPPHPGLTRWRAAFSVTSSLAGTEPNAGRHLSAWFHTAGLTQTRVSADALTFGDPADRRTLASSWIEHTHEPGYREQLAEALGDFSAVAQPRNAQVPELDAPGKQTESAIDQIRAGWNTWADTPGAIFLMPLVTVVATKPAPRENSR